MNPPVIRSSNEGDTMQVDRSAIAIFAEVLFRHCDDGGHVSLRTFRDNAEGVWRPELWAAPRVSNGLGDIITGAIELAEAAAGADESVVFCPPITTFKSANSAAEKDIRNGPALSIDCDKAPEKAREILENTLGPATVTVASGWLWTDPDTGAVQDKVHVHWRLSEPTREFADHIKLKEARRLAMILVGADASAVPLVHPLRWPGSLHTKADPRLARIVNLRADIEIELDDALEQLRKAVAAMPPGQNGADPTKGGYTAPGGHQPSRFGPEADALDIISALTVIANDAKNWKRWSDIGMAVWHASGGSEAGYSAFFAWSSKFDGFDSVKTRERWENFAKYPPGTIGAGSLFHLAREAWPGFERPSELRQRRDNDPGPPPRIIDPPPPGHDKSVADDVLDMGEDMDELPPREWLLGTAFCRGFLSGLTGVGAVGKSAVRYLQYLSLATGRSLTGEHVHKRCRVLIVCLEDDRNEARRRLRAACKHYGVEKEDLKGWLFLWNPKGIKLMERDGRQGVALGTMDGKLRGLIQKYSIDLVGIDPFVKTHTVGENDNAAIDLVASRFAEIADDEGAAVDYIHHQRKGVGLAGDADSGRGASALRDASRLVSTLTGMTPAEASAFNIPDARRRLLVRMDGAKVNLAPALPRPGLS
jgi:hypothetical protein